MGDTSFSFERYEMSEQTFKVQSIIMDLLKGIVSDSELQSIQNTMDSLKSSANEPWWVVFDNKSTGPSANGNFQINPCSQDPSSQLIMVVSRMYFSTAERNSRWMNNGKCCHNGCGECVAGVRVRSQPTCTCCSCSGVLCSRERAKSNSHQNDKLTSVT